MKTVAFVLGLGLAVLAAAPAEARMDESQPLPPPAVTPAATASSSPSPATEVAAISRPRAHVDRRDVVTDVPAPLPAAVASGFDPKYARQVVPYAGKERAGTIVVDTGERLLYLVQDDGTALRYGVGVGRPGFQWRGTHRISRKSEWPGWTPPPAMRKRQPGLPRYMPGGPNNPLGARALYLGSTLYRIHGSNQPASIGQAVSSGCIRMRNEDVIDLYSRVGVGTRVVVL